MHEHGKLETITNFCIWSFGVFFSLYNVYLIGNDFNHSDHDTYKYDDFEMGWFGRYQDISDYEWNCWTRITRNLLPCLVVNFCGAELLRARERTRSSIPLWYTFVTIASCLLTLNTVAVAYLTVIPLCFYAILLLNRPFLLWILGFLFRRYTPSELIGETDEEKYIIEVASSWLILRCIAYCLEAQRTHYRSLSVHLGFCLYLPTVFCGPLISFPAFARGLAAQSKPWTLTRVIEVSRKFLRCIVWYIFTLVSLHFVYVNAILLRPYMVMDMTPWQLGGLGIAMGQFFHLKYVVFYGIPCAWANAEGYETPKSPCCVTRVYLYSFMWRYFDQGLYLFLVRYIYVPLVTIRRTRVAKRFFASVACFLFVYVWHGEETYVLYWVLLNFVSLTIESSAKEICQIQSIKTIIEASLTYANQRRLHCLLASPLHCFSMISNFFFIGNLEVGKIYFYRVLREPLKNITSILFILYGAAQTSLTIELLEKKKIKM